MTPIRRNAASKKLPKAAYIPTLVELISLGAKDKPIPLTTTELAEKLGKSQQIVSKHLEELEKDGQIEKFRRGRKTYVRLTERGSAEFSNLYATLRQAFGGTTKTLEVDGVVFTGLGEAAYYVSLEGYRDQFVQKLGFQPFPGTLNLRLESTLDRQVRRDLSAGVGSVHIEGFKDGKRTFGGADCYRARIGKLPVAIILIERTIYDEGVLEVIAPVNLRRTLNLKDGSDVHVSIMVGLESLKKS